MFQNQNPGNNVGGPMDPTQPQPPPTYNGMQQHQQQQQQANKSLRKKPYVKITEQPAGKALRFRYECEGRSAGSIPGVNSTPENKTFPTIEIVGYKGRAVVVVSCVTKDTPYRPHPHNLVGKEGCKKGVCTLEINSETMRAVFSNLGIQCVKKKDIEGALKAREEIRVDPFKTGFAHRLQPSSIDLNSVRLCFQVFMESEQKGRFTQPLPPVVSEPIYDKKAMSDLVICRLCSCTSTVLGNAQIILLCEKVAKEDIAVRFFEEKNGQMVWEAFGEFQHTDVHKQTAIAFKTPRYHTIDITEPAKVFIQLRRPSDGVTSEALPFEYVPLDSDPAHLRRKRQKTGGDPMHLLLQQQQQQQQQQKQHHQDGRQAANLNCWNTPNIPAIKTEPRDSSPQPFVQYRGQPEMTPSPQPLSPTNNYQNHNNHTNNNTPSPFSIATAGTVGSLPNPHLISPNHHFNTGVGGTPGPGGVGHMPNASPMDMGHDFGAYGAAAQQHQQQLQQQQQQQHHHQQQLATHQQQHFQATNPFVDAGANQWEEKYVPGSNMNDMSNHAGANHFGMQNLLATAGGQGGGGGGGGATHSQHWNLMHNPQQQHHHLQQQQQQQQQQHLQQQPHPHAQQQQYHQHADVDNVVAGANVASSTEHGLSNLLNFDSEQLVRINSEDQQMLRLNSEDLQISNLSIST